MTEEHKDKLKKTGEIALEGLKKTVKYPSKAIEAVSKVAIVYGIFLILTIVRNFSESGLEGDITILGKNDKGQFQTVQIKGRKTLPERTPLNIASFKIDSKSAKTIDYGRHIIEVLPGMHVYGVGSVSSHVDGEIRFGAGITITF